MTWEVRQGDALALLREMPDASVDAIVTDPPYGLEFMGKEWDAPWKRGDGINADAGFSAAQFADGRKLTLPSYTGSTNPKCLSCGGTRRGRRDGTASRAVCVCESPKFPNVRAAEMAAFQAWAQTWSLEVLRVAKPGAHLVAFGGSRTYHRLACAIEDAGWEVRDCLMWLYGSGFPKSLDVSKAINKAAGAERVVIGSESLSNDMRGGRLLRSERGERPPNVRDITSGPATDAALQWDGWGTALKPAHEPIILARKPLSGTVAANVLEHGTGALNVDGCRVPTTDAISSSPGVPSSSEAWVRPWHSDPSAVAARVERSRACKEKAEDLGRWPANVLLDDEAADALDEQSGGRASGYMAAGTEREGIGYHGGLGGTVRHDTHGDKGGASRFFYTAKASAGERHYAGRNGHPTVKPVDLMRWLCRLVTPRGGLVLDPFTGSGSTGVAALAEGFRFLGLEREADYCAMARRRIAGPLFVGTAEAP